MAFGSYCSSRCGSADGKDRRRARKRAAYVADVWRPRIFKRDGYRCQICGGKLAMDKRAPDPMSPSIDHIIPLARGGNHEPANCQAAHFLCNARKSDRESPRGDQLMLVG
ncbi:MAG: HNH endonuclease [Gammaproteobacteria bacterium]|nr:HNH endonuclease [Gammaproteobacteria bacterium]